MKRVVNINAFSSTIGTSIGIDEIIQVEFKASTLLSASKRKGLLSAIETLATRVLPCTLSGEKP